MARAMQVFGFFFFFFFKEGKHQTKESELQKANKKGVLSANRRGKKVGDRRVLGNAAKMGSGCGPSVL
jgi:hypothetical protein